jgi:hypothetical protein
MEVAYRPSVTYNFYDAPTSFIWKKLCTPDHTHPAFLQYLHVHLP